MKNLVTGLLCFALINFSCHSNHPKEDKAEQAEIREHMMNANKIIVQDESKAITEFILRHGWKMEMTGTGLRYNVYEEGSGNRPSVQSTVSISYKVFLLDGTLCYTLDDAHSQKLTLGGSDLTRGLQEGLRLMNEGSKARLVVPYHLGYGFTGDGNKIPPASALFYDVHLIKVENM